MDLNPIVFVIVILGLLFFASAVYAFYWAIKSGQFKKLDQGATVIFDQDEPEGTQTDFFPASKKSSKPTPTPKT